MATRKTPAAKTAAATATKTTARKAAARPAAAQTAPAPAAKPVAAKPAAAAKPTKPTKPVKPVKVDKPKKPKLVRDSFTIPKTEYAVIEALKARAAKAGAPAKKSELLRAGIKALAAMGDADFLAAVKAVPAIKTGRPANP